MLKDILGTLAPLHGVKFFSSACQTVVIYTTDGEPPTVTSVAKGASVRPIRTLGLNPTIGADDIFVVTFTLPLSYCLCYSTEGKPTFITTPERNSIISMTPEREAEAWLRRVG